MAEWFVYILRCADDTLYTGITRDVERRVREHNADNRRGAAYTRGRRPVHVIYREACGSRSQATRREHQIRTMTRNDKEKLAKSP